MYIRLLMLYVFTKIDQFFYVFYIYIYNILFNVIVVLIRRIWLLDIHFDYCSMKMWTLWRARFQPISPMNFRRSGTDQRAALKNDSGCTRKNVSAVDGTDSGIFPEASWSLQIDLLQEHGARTTLARVCPKTNHRYPADHRVCQDGSWIHEALAGRPDCSIKGW